MQQLQEVIDFVKIQDPKKIPKIPFTNRLQKIQLSNDFIYLSKTQISL
jgi:hypothetical protein